MNQEIEELLANYVSGQLSEEQAQTLLESCQASEETGSRLVRLTQIDRLAALALDDDGKVFAREFRCRLEADREEDEFSVGIIGRLQRRKVFRLVTGIAAALVISLIGLSVLLMGGGDGVAMLVRVESSDWSSAAKEFRVGDTIAFERGLAEIYYHKGVGIVIEGPARFEITGASEGYLHYGKLVAEIDDAKARGFIIDGPNGRLIDLGTKFGVSVKADGEMEVHVLEGEVDAVSHDGVTANLRENEAIRLRPDGFVRLPGADGGSFVTQMPPEGGKVASYVRWGFDELEGMVVRNTGRDLAADHADAELKSFGKTSSLPQSVSGPFGKAMRFDGRGAHIESSYHGISGAAPRTVAFWVRVPRDLGLLESYGIINWGNVRAYGGAWQISINSTANDGPIGNLRIGTHEGFVIGTTDLRDDEWHHCAVVMYGEPNGSPNTATHVLLYVDGELEPAARKSVRMINTKALPEQEDHGIWMGRNLGYEFEGAPAGESYGKFFRGEIDEMIISDTALSWAQIQRLMGENKMPE